MFNRTKKFLTIQMLATMDPRKVQAISEKRALRAFVAASHAPAYRQYLRECGVEVSSIRSIDDFKARIPVVDKDKTFKLYALEIEKLCLAHQIKDPQLIVSSSGHSGYFSYGLSTRRELKKAQEDIDFMLDHFFGVSSKTTLLVNALPMGVKIQSSSVTIADTSVRSDIAIGVIKTFAPCFEQIILVGENSFVKKILEDGLREGIVWKNLRIHFILGEEILPENMRTYFARILNVNPDDEKNTTLIGSSFGVAEFGLNLFYETRELIRLRRLLQRDKKLKGALIGRDADNLPALLHYNPWRIYVEELPKASGGCADLVLTNLREKTNIPLVRYNIKDEGMIIDFARLKDVLDTFNAKEYLPRVRLPIVAVWGRDKIACDDKTSVRPEFIKEILYEDASVAAEITGYFRLSVSKAGGLKVEIQTAPTTHISQLLEDKIRNLLTERLPAASEIVLYPYRDFPYGMELNYERKFQYI
jgi:phenylacetate-CoA ligase